MAIDRARGARRIPEEQWRALESVDLAGEMRTHVPLLQSMPRFLRGAFRSAMLVSLMAMQRAYAQPGCEGLQEQRRAWTLFQLTSRMILYWSQKT